MMVHRISVVFFLLVALSTNSCWGQGSDACQKQIVEPAVTAVVAMLRDAQQQTDAAKKRDDTKSARDFFSNALNNADYVWACAGSPEQGTLDEKLAGVFEARRIDKQVGASSGGPGTTSLVPSGSVPALLGLAVEYGGMTQAFSGTTATFRTTPAKLIGAFASAYGPNATEPSEATMQALQRISVSVSFDTSRTDGVGTGSGATLLANYQQLSQTSLRINLINDRDPLSPKNWRRIRKFSQSPKSQSLANAGAKLLRPVLDLTKFDDALNAAMATFDGQKASPDEEGLKRAMIDYFEKVHALGVTTPDWQGRLDAYRVVRLAFDEEHKSLYKTIAKAPSLTFEYNFARPPVVNGTAADGTSIPSIAPPDLSTASLVYVASLYESEYTLNATARFFNEARSGMSGNFRDFQLAGKWDIPVGRVPAFIAKGTLTFSGLFEHLHQKPLGIDLLINDQKVNKPGNIGVFQAKYSIPVGDSGLQVPISFTASNRTELIQEKELRGNIGITFDLDKLFVRAK